MKTIPRYAIRLLPAGALVALLCAFSAGKPSPFIVHEWGTFTSVQGADGVLLDWRPLQISVLPQFVYDWTKPGLERMRAPMPGFGKGGVIALQRMETPVLYFYADKEQTVDVSVKFPKGLITEWYPQAREIGPSFVSIPPLITNLDYYAHQAGARPTFTFSSILSNKRVAESRVRWPKVRILPAHDYPGLQGALPRDASGSHYFAARATDSDFVQIASLDPTNPAPQNEKFIFYRGVGDFPTPLTVTMDADNHVTVQNTGSEQLDGLILLSRDHGTGSFVTLGPLGANSQRSAETESATSRLPAEALAKALGDAMAQSLVKAGLYPREARAMIETWKDSWFGEDGVRVLYVLPRAWTDRTLPLSLAPTPRELVRVMVGRSEVLTPALQRQLAEALKKAAHGDAEARSTVLAEFKQLGRFAEPAVLLAARNSDAALLQIGWTLLQARSN
jgi:hypothetical protein